jgi:hypothetical protein
MIELKVMNLFICSIAESVFILDQQVLFDKIDLLFISKFYKINNKNDDDSNKEEKTDVNMFAFITEFVIVFIV